MKIVIEFDVPEFVDENDVDPLDFSGRMVIKVATAIYDGKREGSLMDDNGNSVGTWKGSE